MLVFLEGPLIKSTCQQVYITVVTSTVSTPLNFMWCISFCHRGSMLVWVWDSVIWSSCRDISISVLNMAVRWWQECYRDVWDFGKTQQAQQVTAGHSGTQQGTARHKRAGTAGHSEAQQGTVGYSKEQQGTRQRLQWDTAGTARHSKSQQVTVGTAKHSKAQRDTAGHSKTAGHRF